MKFLRFIWYVLYSILECFLGVIALIWGFSLLFFGWAFALEPIVESSAWYNWILYLIYISPLVIGIILWLSNIWKTFEKEG